VGGTNLIITISKKNNSLNGGYRMYINYGVSQVCLGAELDAEAFFIPVCCLWEGSPKFKA
jgi:hypothetical protein